jgi:hypothetical protein
MNRIIERQNEDLQLKRLLAQRRLYSRAKTLLVTQTLLAVPGAAVWYGLVAWKPEWKVFGALWGTLVVLSDFFIFTPWQQGLKEKAARIQEQFDCEVLELPWAEILVDQRPAAETIAEWGILKSDETYETFKLLGWYPRDIAQLPIELARAICQRTNCSWDSRLRRKYAAWIVAVVVTLLVAGVAVGIGTKTPLDAFFLGFVLPFMPAFILGIRQFTEHRQAADRLEKLRQKVEKQWDQILSGTASAAAVTEAARRVQDVIFEQRRKNPLVFDTIYFWLRDEQEAIMQSSAQDLVAEAQTRMMARNRQNS